MNNITRRFVSVAILALTTSLYAPQVSGQEIVPPPDFNPLNQSPIPEPVNISRFVKNEAAAIRLGKALFWDMQVGSDGIQACGTCHFSHFADSRMKNQLNPGTNSGDAVFGNNTTGVAGFPQFGPNYELQPGDFPLHRRGAPADSQDSPIVRDTNDIVSSQGVRLAEFVDVVPGSAEDLVNPVPDPVFNVDGVNTRRVEPRNTPTVVNAVFNFTNFWDGRANFLFNGENPFGPADPNAGVWFNDPDLGLVKQPVTIQFGSLASQAVGPPVSDTEMSARGRTFPKIGRKMLSLTPLGKQLIHPGDSALGPLSRATLASDGTLEGSRGLNTTYIAMIRSAFQDDLWNSSALTPESFTQMEANFSLFFGLAVQLYEATLVSDDSPLDQWLGGDPNALTQQQKEGFNIFNNNFCAECHGGIEFTNASAAASEFVNNFDNALIEQMFVFDGTDAIYDDGFNNIGVTQTTDDLGRGGSAPFINPLTLEPFPLAFTSLAELQAQQLLPFETPILDPNLPPNFPDNRNGLFKVPDLRNVELTAPYFHNGSLMTLDEVVDFYVRGGNFPEVNSGDLDPLIGNGLSGLRGDEQKKAALVAFLKSLTDERVRNGSAPFDHPEIFVPEGDPEVLVRIPATDGGGLTAPVSPMAPVITSTAPTTAFVNESFVYDANGFDPNGEPITFALIVSPEGMAMDAATGMITWTPVTADLGAHPVTFRVTDPGALSSDQSFTVTVSERPPSPVEITPGSGTPPPASSVDLSPLPSQQESSSGNTTVVPEESSEEMPGSPEGSGVEEGDGASGGGGCTLIPKTRGR